MGNKERMKGNRMADNVTNELLLEHMKQMQAKLAEHDGKFDRLFWRAPIG